MVGEMSFLIESALRRGDIAIIIIYMAAFLTDGHDAIVLKNSRR